jgi:RNA polymerase sigma-70 factor, ECF subfamily
MTSEDLSEALSKIALGDRAAFRHLYAATSAKLFGICLRVMRNRSDAEDVLQEAYVKIWRNASKFQVSGASPISWLAAIARNQAIDRLRARKPEALDIEDAFEVADEGAGPELDLLASADSSRLGQCLAELKPDRAAAVKAAYLDGYSYKELAHQHGLPLNTVRTWLRRSLLSLRECLSR